MLLSKCYQVIAIHQAFIGTTKLDVGALQTVAEA